MSACCTGADKRAHRRSCRDSFGVVSYFRIVYLADGTYLLWKPLSPIPGWRDGVEWDSVGPYRELDLAEQVADMVADREALTFVSQWRHEDVSDTPFPPGGRVSSGE